MRYKKDDTLFFENRVQREFRITAGIILGQLYIHIYINICIVSEKLGEITTSKRVGKLKVKMITEGQRFAS